ncbi:FAD-dependent oxidoreductase [Geomonas sp. RF6]|uniref:glycerol-3-phosphate dehydrogenase/oxidase n=1 Tax=Geomonas sp. RF6 TaxID=2897342 RepID=UPI001E3F376D|nr:FAD-dependent oxidoreductase [Geomonas sp. RF6]UFS69500.1 FAD-dependent oxidoreductase [Geomonas sp. RF6]
MIRDALLERLREGEVFDLLIIGGGSVGCGIALDAATRGLSVALVEQGDFASGTSGRSTKLLHGGVRYLEAALLRFDRVQFRLVREALFERALLLRLAPHLTRRLTLVTPVYRNLELPYIFAGLKIYDALSGKMGIGPSRLLSRTETLRRCPAIRGMGLKGGVLYYDGQFDDARMNLALALTALQHGALVVNHVEAVSLLKEKGMVAGAVARDAYTAETFRIRARGVINAAGPRADRVRLLDDAGAAPLLRPSSGVHIVLDRRFAPPDAGITIPRTEDGRVLFLLPWQGHCLVGTTDEPASCDDDPVATEGEIEYLLRHLNRYLSVRVQRSDVKAAWSALRPLLSRDPLAMTARLARDHLVTVSSSGLITVAGGKWTTYRRMAMDAVDAAVTRHSLPQCSPCCTEKILLAGAEGFDPHASLRLPEGRALPAESARHLLRTYGAKAQEVASLCHGELAEALVQGHPYLKGEVLYAVRHELALSAADVLARRLPLALIDAVAARAAAEVVICLMARELGWDAVREGKERGDLERVLPASGTT